MKQIKNINRQIEIERHSEPQWLSNRLYHDRYKSALSVTVLISALKTPIRGMGIYLAKSSFKGF